MPHVHFLSRRLFHGLCVCFTGISSVIPASPRCARIRRDNNIGEVVQMHLVEKPPIGQFLVTLILLIGVALLLMAFRSAVLPE